MTFVEIPEWINDFNAMISAVSTIINDPDESVLMAVHNGNSAFVIVVNHKRKISSSMFIGDKVAFMNKLKDEYLLSSVDSSEIWAYAWILQHSSAIIHPDALNM